MQLTTQQTIHTLLRNCTPFLQPVTGRYGLWLQVWNRLTSQTIIPIVKSQFLFLLNMHKSTRDTRQETPKLLNSTSCNKGDLYTTFILLYSFCQVVHAFMLATWMTVTVDQLDRHLQRKMTCKITKCKFYYHVFFNWIVDVLCKSKGVSLSGVHMPLVRRHLQTEFSTLKTAIA